MLYLTLADPLTSGDPELISAIADAGVDILELGLPTPSVGPRGMEIGRSFARCGDVEPDRVWRELSKLRGRLPTLPIVLLIYPETIADIGFPTLLDKSVAAGVDGLVLTTPNDVELRRVRSVGLSAIPLIRPTHGPRDVRHWEDHASHLTYRTLASKTGDALTEKMIVQRVGDISSAATKPVFAGFGIRYESEIRLLVPQVAGVVIGSEFLRLIANEDRSTRTARAIELVRGWKAATRISPSGEALAHTPVADAAGWRHAHP